MSRLTLCLPKSTRSDLFPIPRSRSSALVFGIGYLGLRNSPALRARRWCRRRDTALGIGAGALLRLRCRRCRSRCRRLSRFLRLRSDDCGTRAGPSTPHGLARYGRVRRRLVRTRSPRGGARDLLSPSRPRRLLPRCLSRGLRCRARAGSRPRRRCDRASLPRRLASGRRSRPARRRLAGSRLPGLGLYGRNRACLERGESVAEFLDQLLPSRERSGHLPNRELAVRDEEVERAGGVIGCAVQSLSGFLFQERSSLLRVESIPLCPSACREVTMKPDGLAPARGVTPAPGETCRISPPCLLRSTMSE